MNIQQEQHSEQQWLIRVAGRLDHELTPQLNTILNEHIEAGHYHLIVDLSQTTYINSGGLRCLVSAWRKVRENQGNLILCGLNSRLMNTFSMVGFDKVFQIITDCNQLPDNS
ncbi:MAG: anti-sigma factor antagonist [Chloroflexi bacterium]|nr:MAG: anti-sigma factor antagonist [Chloroflexota bacterium]